MSLTPKQRAARVTRTVRDYRRQLIAREQTAQRQLVASYNAAFDTLIEELQAAIDNAQRAIDEGNPIVNTFRVQRAVELSRQAEQLLADIARESGETVSQQRVGAARDAFKAAGDLLDSVMGEPPESFPNASSFMTVPSGAIEEITGSLSGGPVQELLNRYNADGAHEAGRILTGAIATGQHPDLIAKALREALDIPLWKSARIARTEINRTFREGLRATWTANRHIVSKWRWRSARSLTTCAACWAMDGQLFDVEEPMETHPGCRCSSEPEPIGWGDLAAKHGITMPAGDWGIPAEPTGPEAFALLPAADQQRILDPGRQDGATPRYDAYAAGQVTLQDFVHTSHSDDWGTTRREAGLTAALAAAEKRKP